MPPHRQTRRWFLRAATCVAAAPAGLQGCALPRPAQDDLTPPPPICEQPVDPQVALSVQFELCVYDVPVCSVACQVTRQGQPRAGEPAAGRVVLTHQGNGACTRTTAAGDQQRVCEVHGRRFDIATSRRKVMRAKGQPPLSKDMHGDAVAYEDAYYPTERGYLVPYIVGTRAAFDRQKVVFDTTQDQAHDTNELLILWDAQAKAIRKCLLDGEEIDVE